MLVTGCHHPREAMSCRNVDREGQEIYVCCGECGANVTVSASAILTARDLAVWARVGKPETVPTIVNGEDRTSIPLQEHR